MILCASIVCSEEQEKDDPATRVRRTRTGQPQRRVEVKKGTTRHPGCVKLTLVNPNGELK